MTVELSIIVPVYNEERNISKFLNNLKEVLDVILIRYEVIIVNDGSQDNILEVLQKEKKLNTYIRVLSYIQNKGKGHAVRTGVLESVGELVMILDGDLDIQPKIITEYLNEIRKYDVVIASKKHPLSKINAPLSRKFFSLIFNLIVRIRYWNKDKRYSIRLKSRKWKLVTQDFQSDACKSLRI